jgi:hypothetical protein
MVVIAASTRFPYGTVARLERQAAERIQSSIQRQADVIGMDEDANRRSPAPYVDDGGRAPGRRSAGIIATDTKEGPCRFLLSTGRRGCRIRRQPQVTPAATANSS